MNVKVRVVVNEPLHLVDKVDGMGILHGAAVKKKESMEQNSLEQ